MWKSFFEIHYFTATYSIVSLRNETLTLHCDCKNVLFRSLKCNVVLERFQRSIASLWFACCHSQSGIDCRTDSGEELYCLWGNNTWKLWNWKSANEREFCDVIKESLSSSGWGVFGGHSRRDSNHAHSCILHTVSELPVLLPSHPRMCSLYVYFLHSVRKVWGSNHKVFCLF